MFELPSMARSGESLGREDGNLSCIGWGVGAGARFDFRRYLN